MNLLLLNTLKTTLENTACEEHQAKPVVEIKEDTITINCCCDPFHKKCADLVTEILELMEFKDWVVEHSRSKR